MRGNHVILGRQDYSEPPPLPPEALARIGMCAILPRSPDRVKPLCWHDANGVDPNDPVLALCRD